MLAFSNVITSVSGHNNNRSQIILQGSVEERETLDVQHVDLVNEQNPGSDLRLALLPPLRDLGVDLVPHFRLDLSSVPAEQGEETLGPAVDDVDLVEGDGVDDLLPLLELPLGALDEPGAGSGGVIVPSSGETSSCNQSSLRCHQNYLTQQLTQLCDLPRGLVDGDDVSGLNLLLHHGL